MQRGFHRDGAGAGPHVPDHGILTKTEARKGGRADLALRHRHLSADEGAVRQAEALRDALGPGIFKEDQGQPVCQMRAHLVREAGIDPLLRIGEALAHGDLHLGHRKIDQRLGAGPHVALISHEGQHIAVRAHERDQISLPSVDADDAGLLLRNAGLSKKISDRGEPRAGRDRKFVLRERP